MWRYFGGLLLRLRETFGAGDDLALLDRAFGPTSFVFLTRADKLGQAVSLWRAIQTWSWRADDGPGLSVEPVYSFAAIDHLIRRLELDEADWDRWFQSVGVAPHRLEYEALTSDYVETTSRVLAFVGAPGDVRFDGLPPLRRQADEASERWAERYRSDLERSQTPEIV
jgi:LPS sulfotransferase NodH